MVVRIRASVLKKTFDEIENLFRLNSIQPVQRLYDLQFLISGCHKIVVDDNTNNGKLSAIVSLTCKR